MKLYLGEIRKGPEEDPTNSGCCAVRLFNRQNDEQEVKDEHLKWATPMHPITSAATARVGVVPAGMRQGTRVLVTYLDDDAGEQYPIILGPLGRGELPMEKGLGKQSDQQSAGKINEQTKGPDHPNPAREQP